MLLSILPLSLVSLLTKGPHILPIAIPQIVLKLPLILPRAILPLQMPLPMHFRLQPLARINLAISPPVNSLAADLIVNKLTLVDAAIRDHQGALASLHAISELPFILRAIWPLLNALPVLLMIEPVTIIAGPVRLDADAFTVHLVLDP
jgi:hypothetical protein